MTRGRVTRGRYRESSPDTRSRDPSTEYRRPVWKLESEMLEGGTKEDGNSDTCVPSSILPVGDGHNNTHDAEHMWLAPVVGIPTTKRPRLTRATRKKTQDVSVKEETRGKRTFQKTFQNVSKLETGTEGKPNPKNEKEDTHQARSPFLSLSFLPFSLLGRLCEDRPNEIFVAFDEPVAISYITLWNYAKTPARGVGEIEHGGAASLGEAVFPSFETYTQKYPTDAPRQTRIGSPSTTSSCTAACSRRRRASPRETRASASGVSREKKKEKGKETKEQ